MYEGKTQLTRIWTIKSDDVEKMKENAKAHTDWMKETHYRDGDKKLHFLNWSIEEEKNDGIATGNTFFGNRLRAINLQESTCSSLECLK